MALHVDFTSREKVLAGDFLWGGSGLGSGRSHWFLRMAQGFPLGVQRVQLLESFLNGPGQGCLPSEGDDRASFFAVLEIGCESLVVLVNYRDHWWRDAQAQLHQFANLAPEDLPLPHGVPFPNDRL